MPEDKNPNLPYKYIGTVTFDPNFSLTKKNRLISGFEEILKGTMYKRKGDEYYLRVAKEYHKVDGQDDLEAPHLHFILESKRLLAVTTVNNVLETLKEKCGRSQFYKATTMKYISYKNYIYKDVHKHLERGEHTYYEKYIEMYDKVDWVEKILKGYEQEDLDEEL